MTRQPSRLGLEMTLEHWTWSEKKNAQNISKHGLSFDTAKFVFADPMAQTLPDPFDDEERWRTFGEIRGQLILVVHTDPIYLDDRLVKSGRIISARKALARERRWFEEQKYD